MELNTRLLEKDFLHQVENYIEIALTYFYIGKGFDIDDISIYIESPERYDQHPGTKFYISIKIDDEQIDDVYFDCDASQLKGSKEEEKKELNKLLLQFNKWFEGLASM